MKSMIKKSAVVVFFAVIAIAPVAFAQGGYGGHMMGGYGYGGNTMGPGYGGNMMGPGYGGYMMGPGYGGHMMGHGYGGYMMGPGYGGHMGWWGDEDNRGLSQEQAEKLEAARESFYRQTRPLRDQIYDKSVELRREFAKPNPDPARLSEIQKQISQLESQFDQKRLDYQLQIRKIVPQADEG